MAVQGNPRKMVQQWAEKEMRNLIRLNTAGIRSPKPLLLRLGPNALSLSFCALAPYVCWALMGMRAAKWVSVLYLRHRRLHGLVMTFIGVDGGAAPRLKDAHFSSSRARLLYIECVRAMRTMYQKCKLVHGDLSEYNMLYHESHLFIIDVSQRYFRAPC